MSGQKPTRPVTQTCRFDHQHRHGSARCYQGGCGCVPCRDGNTMRVTDYRARKKTEDVDARVPAGIDLANHVNELRAAGLPIAAIADLAGVAYNVVENVSKSPTARVRIVSRDALWGVTADMYKRPRMPRKQIPNVGVSRRLKALMYMGYHGADLMRRMGMDERYITRLVNSEWVYQSTFEKVADLYDELWCVPAPDTYGGRRAAARARREGWVGPLGWDEETIDDPAAEPATTREVRPNGAELLSEVAHLLEAGESPEHVANILGRKLSTITRLADRHGEKTIASAFAAALRAA